jgi:hypothetical protein
MQCEFDRIPLADADHRAWDGSIIGPIFIAHPIGEEADDRLGFKRDMNQHRLLSVDWRRNLRLRHTPEVCGQSGKGRLISDQASSRRGHLRSRQRRKATNCSLKKRRRSYIFEFRGNDYDFEGLRLVRGQGRDDLLCMRPYY